VDEVSAGDNERAAAVAFLRAAALRQREAACIADASRELRNMRARIAEYVGMLANQIERGEHRRGHGR